MSLQESESRVVLLVRLLNAIDQGRHSFEALKDRVAEGGRRPSTRSLRRYLAILSNAGFPLHFDRGANVYRFADGYSLRRLDLTGGELFGLVALRSLGASIGGTIGESIDDVAEKLIGSAGRGARARVEAASPVAFRLSEIGLDESGERAFALLSSAERSSRSVRFTYSDKEGKRSKRTADPYGFIVNAGRVYCLAYDHARRDKRTFAVDSISEPAVLAKSFTRPIGFSVEEYASASISGVLHHGGAPVTVRVRFASRVAKAASAARVVADRRVVPLADGSVEIAYRVGDVDELVRWVLGWGAQAEILAPASARKRIAALAASVAKTYEPDSAAGSGGVGRCRSDARRSHPARSCSCAFSGKRSFEDHILWCPKKSHASLAAPDPARASKPGSAGGHDVQAAGRLDFRATQDVFFRASLSRKSSRASGEQDVRSERPRGGNVVPSGAARIDEAHRALARWAPTCSHTCLACLAPWSESPTDAGGRFDLTNCGNAARHGGSRAIYRDRHVRRPSRRLEVREW